MKKLAQFVIICILGLSFSACEMETSDNGQLDGFWQLTSVDSLNSGRSADMHQSGIYWGIQVHLLSIKDMKKDQSFMFRFSMTGDTLRLYAPIKDIRHSAGEVLDEHVMTPMELRNIGFSHLEERFKVLQLTGSRMALQNERLRMYFRKY